LKVDFSRYCTLKVGTTKDVLEIDTIGDFDSYNIIGGGSNLLVTENAKDLALLGKEFNFIELKDGILKVGGATPNAKVANFCKKQNIGGFEFLAHLPGLVGGAVKMNAGLKEWEIKNILLGITAKDGFIDAASLGMEYRKSGIKTTIFEALFEVKYGWSDSMLEMFKAMRNNQPKEASAGSFFKNPIGDFAGRLIESVGLRGYVHKNASFSDKHANFLVNLGGANVESVLELKELAKKRVFEEHGIRLEEEVVIL